MSECIGIVLFRFDFLRQIDMVSRFGYTMNKKMWISKMEDVLMVKMMSIKETAKLPLPVGVSDYCLASSEYYYIDKTMMIKDFIDERPLVTLFTRPRRFGKTLNMDMLRTFFEKTDKDTSIYFKDKKYGHVEKNTGSIRENIRLFF